MIRRNSKSITFVCMCLLLFLCTACTASRTSGEISSIGGSSNKPISRQRTTPIRVNASIIVQPESLRGVSGKGPLVVTYLTLMPGGKIKHGQVVLQDRALVFNSVNKLSNIKSQLVLIALAVTVNNTSRKPILNQATFFQLMGAEGDTFTYQLNRPSRFYGAVPAFSSRSGTIVFQIPKAATSQLRLLYRPEIAAETVLVSLKV